MPWPRSPPRAASPEKSLVGKALIPVQEFIQTESASGIILIAAAALAFAWANSPWAPSYFALLDLRIGIGVGAWSLEKPLLLWVNDLLMALFFFVIGLEIKREILVGELAGWQRAALPAAGALGGMVVPALIYLAFTAGEPTMRGWGVPMATDIAFALGVLALLGERVPLGLKVFLLALAIVDDLGAVLVIALFYTEAVDGASLLVSLLLWGAALAYGRASGEQPLVFALLGLVMWYFMLKSGIHATIQGVLMALAVPLRHRLSMQDLQQELRTLSSHGGGFEQVEVRDRAPRGGAGQGAQPFAPPGARARPVRGVRHHAGVRLLQRRRRARRQRGWADQRGLARRVCWPAARQAARRCRVRVHRGQERPRPAAGRRRPGPA